MQIHFRLYFLGVSLEQALNSQLSKVQPLVQSKVHAKQLSKLCILCCFSIPCLKFGEKAGDQVCFDGID